MSRFQNQEISFEVPEGWIDQSTTSFVFPEAATGVTLTSERARPGETLDGAVAALRVSLAALFPGFLVLRVRPRRLGAAEGRELIVEWRHEIGQLRHVLVLALHDGQLWTLTASTPCARLAETEAAIARAIASFAVLEPSRGFQPAAWAGGAGSR